MRATRTGRWFILSIVCLGLGGSFAFLVGMARAPFAFRFLPPDYFHYALVGHVTLAILLWLLSFAVVLWSYHFRTPVNGMSFWLAVSGAALVAGSSLSAAGEPVLNNYVPVLAHPVFLVGLAMFFAGFSLNVIRYFREAVSGIRSDDMVINALSTALFISAVMIIAVIASITLFGGEIEKYPARLFYERLFWTPGHIQQILNGAMLVAVWYALGRIITGKNLECRSLLKNANRLLIASALLLLFASFVLDPLDGAMRISCEIVYAIGLGVPLFLHIGNIVRQLRWNFKTPAAAALTISIAIYLSGILIAYAGFQDDTRVPAHYHGVVTALTLALMGFSFQMISGYGLKIFSPKAAKLQPYMYGAGMLLFIAGLFISGLLGAPRKTYGVGWTDNPLTLASLAMMGTGTLLAVIGGAIFVICTGVALMGKPATLFDNNRLNQLD